MCKIGGIKKSLWNGLNLNHLTIYTKIRVFFFSELFSREDRLRNTYRKTTFIVVLRKYCETQHVLTVILMKQMKLLRIQKHL